MNHRSWFPMLLIGASLLLIVAFAVFTKPHEGGERISAKAPAVVPITEEEYQSAVNTILLAYQASHNAKSAYDALVLLRVPALDLQLHLDLVVALGKVVNGDADEGAARLQALKAQYPWLPL